jgi:hypothetical protein
MQRASSTGPGDRAVLTATWDRSLPPEPFHDLYATRRPSDATTVWCGYRDEYRVAIHHRPLQFRGSYVTDLGVNDGIATTLTLGHVVIAVVMHFGAAPPHNQVLRGADEVPIWPPTLGLDRRVWPPRPLTNEALARWMEPGRPQVANPVGAT